LRFVESQIVKSQPNVEEELFEYLDRITPRRRLKKRNVGIVSHLYGFGDSQWPTLESTAERFGIGTRERVRQVLNETFRNYVSPADLPRLRECAALLGSKTAWVGSEFLKAISDSGYSSARLGAKGLLNLMHDLSLCVQYDLYNLDFAKIGRANVKTELNNFVIESKMAEALKKALKKARTLPGQQGLANTRSLAPLSKDVDLNVLLTALRMDPNAWMMPDGKDYWYCLENRENTLIGMAQKVFALADEIDFQRLAQCMSNGLKARTLQHEYPDPGLILSFIRGSKYFSCGKRNARFLGEPGELTAIQVAIVRFFRKRPAADWQEISSYLYAAGFGRALVSKAVLQSPLVCVDRTPGRGNHSYSLISHARTPDRAGSAKRDPVG
jgi:hypothetical protein